MRASLVTALLLTSILPLASPVGAQTFQGGIRGKVTDASGAVIGLVKITLTDTATGIKRSEVSNDEGGYSFTALNPSTYSITAEKPGFKTLQENGLIVATQEFLGADLKMTVGCSHRKT